MRAPSLPTTHNRSSKKIISSLLPSLRKVPNKIGFVNNLIKFGKYLLKISTVEQKGKQKFHLIYKRKKERLYFKTQNRNGIVPNTTYIPTKNVTNYPNKVK